MLTGYILGNRFSVEELYKQKFDFAVFPASSGSADHNPYLARRLGEALSRDRRIGYSHHALGGDPMDEAECFARTVEGYFGVGLPVVHLPETTKGRGDWMLSFLDRYSYLSGCKPAIFGNQAKLNQVEWSEMASEGYYPWLWNVPPATVKYPLKQIPKLLEPWSKPKLYSYGYSVDEMLPSALFGSTSTWASMVLGVENELIY